MAASIDFYFDFSSPYGYFASTRIDALAAQFGRSVNWRPMLLGAVFKVTGGQPLPAIPLKKEYAARDLARCARLYAVPFRPPSRFPVATQAPSRAFYWLADQDAERAKVLAADLFRAYFVDDRDISSPEVTADVAAEAGVDRAALLAGLRDAASQLAGGESPGRLASAIEFILEGLHLHNKLNKKESGAGARFQAT